MDSTEITEERPKVWNYNPHTRMDEEGRWWLIGLPGGPQPLLGPETKEQARKI